MSFVRTDGGRLASKRPKQTKDCFVRALALASEITYDEAFELVKQMSGRVTHKGTPKKPMIKGLESAVINGYKFTYVSLGVPKAGEKRLTNRGALATLDPNSRFIICNAKHVTTLINNEFYDDCEEWVFDWSRCVYSYWKVHREDN